MTYEKLMCTITITGGVSGNLLYYVENKKCNLFVIDVTWKVRRFEFDVFRDPEIQALLKKEDVRLVHWRDLRDLQRA